MIINKILKQFDIDYTNEKLSPASMQVIIASLTLSLSAITQFIVDIVFEGLSLLKLIPSIPFRPNFLSLTFLSALLGYQTVAGLRRRELDITRNALQMGIVVELSLIIGDIIFLINNPEPFLIFFRVSFVFFTLINTLLILFIWRRSHISVFSE